MNAYRERLYGRPSIETELCPFCGRMATNRHHIIPKGLGGSKREKDIPTVTVCGMGNASGCHGKLHGNGGRIYLDWNDDGFWEWCNAPGMRYEQARATCEWHRVKED